MQFSIDLFEDRGKLLKWAEEILISALKHAERLIDSGCDMISINNDCVFNSGTFISPDDFAELTTPYMKELVGFIKKKNVKVIFHSDGNLMSVLDQIIEINPDILHSIDPMAGMDIAFLGDSVTHGVFELHQGYNCEMIMFGNV